MRFRTRLLLIFTVAIAASAARVKGGPETEPAGEWRLEGARP